MQFLRVYAILLSKMTGYAKSFDETKYMYFLIIDDKFLKKKS